MTAKRPTAARRYSPPNRPMQHASRRAGWMALPANAEDAVGDVIAAAFGSILAAFEEEGAEPPKALTKLLEHTRAGITKELCGMVGTWRPATTSAGKVRRGVCPDVAATRAAKPVKARINIMRSRSKKFCLIPCWTASVDLEFELLTEKINDNMGDLFKRWKS
jgi:hypothetical protein